MQRQFSAILVAAFLTIIGLTGCKEQVTPEQKSILSLVSIAAKERAVAFDAVKSQIGAKDPKDAESVQKFVARHSEGLNLSAAQLADTNEAVKAGSKLSESARDALIAEAETSAACALTFRALSKFVSTNEQLAPFIESHQKGLDSQAHLMGRIKELFSTAPKE